MQKYIQKESKYKTSLTRKPDTKNVFVSVIIERDGKVNFVKIARGYNGKLDAEAQRIVEKMPNWLPGKLNNGSTARMSLMFPFWFE
ncbi:MAG: hypothetical protein EOP53_26075 [Sphingobacteriales bacterium]|nr:MAG: hypothetical protein EOP53_26075 [Sphingobacteriales bacterium]